MSSEGARPAGRRPFVECWPNGPFARCEPSASAASALRKPDFTPPGPQQFSLVHSVRLSHDGMAYVADRENRPVQCAAGWGTDGRVRRRGGFERAPPSPSG